MELFIGICLAFTLTLLWARFGLRKLRDQCLRTRSARDTRTFNIAYVVTCAIGGGCFLECVLGGLIYLANGAPPTIGYQQLCIGIGFIGGGLQGLIALFERPSGLSTNK